MLYIVTVVTLFIGLGIGLLLTLHTNKKLDDE